MKIKAGIIGASGYTGYELVKILGRHGKVELSSLNSKSHSGQTVRSLYNDFWDDKLRFTNLSIDEINKMGVDVVFTALPSKESIDVVQKLKTRVIDLSADFRFSNPKVYEKVYGIKNDSKIKAVYGLPELFRDEIKKAKVVANPGCYATACILAALPIQKFASSIIFDCKSGYSGAGAKPTYANQPENYADNIIAYNITKHRHKYEIEQFIKTKLSFTPHVIPVFRGLMCTMHAILKKKGSSEKIKKLYKGFYRKEPFVKITEGKLPELHDVQNNNYCCVGGFEIDENNQLVVVSVIDNLLKGASGQAVQNMNIMFGIDESEGLV
ncbi:N-acetyl-gamma-glutamyl-phosphate reductase [Candidatus Woesearchaeota archaeon]|nr:N-acetyl-gamma-glutamyl-phosphate reductase [Candidatus Woesearchaeota archaeon]